MSYRPPEAGYRFDDNNNWMTWKTENITSDDIEASYGIFENSYLENGEWIGTGTYGVFQIGVMVPTGAYPTFKDFSAANLFLNNVEEDPYQNSHGLHVYSAEEFWVENRGKSYSEIINQQPPKDGLPGGPSMRMVINPRNGRIMDMRHVMVIGFGSTTIYRGNPIMGNIIGFGAEIVQWFGPMFGGDTRGSAFDKQDLYSNNLGAYFGTYYWYTGKFTKDWPTSFYNWLNKK